MRTYLVLCLAIFVTCASARQTAPQSKSEVTLRGAEYAFSISVPEKWDVDTASRALRYAARAVLYAPTLGSGQCLIEVLPATKSIEGKNTLANLLSYAAKLDSSHGARHNQDPALQTKDGNKVPVITSAYKDWQEVNVYIDDVNAVIVFSLYVPDLRVQEEALHALTAIVKSYSSLAIGSGQKQ
jgi:hypothetical protein